MAARHLINENGKPFEDRELDALAKDLERLPSVKIFVMRMLEQQLGTQRIEC
jgi:hypothetical protein